MCSRDGVDCDGNDAWENACDDVGNDVGVDGDGDGDGDGDAQWPL